VMKQLLQLLEYGLGPLQHLANDRLNSYIWISI
jgi:hypothetical protein